MADLRHCVWVSLLQWPKQGDGDKPEWLGEPQNDKHLANVDTDDDVKKQYPGSK